MTPTDINGLTHDAYAVLWPDDDPPGDKRDPDKFAFFYLINPEPEPEPERA